MANISKNTENLTNSSLIRAVLIVRAFSQSLLAGDNESDQNGEKRMAERAMPLISVTKRNGRMNAKKIKMRSEESNESDKNCNR